MDTHKTPAAASLPPETASAEGIYPVGANWNLDESIGYLVKKLAVCLQRHVDTRMVNLGLTDSQWKPLLMLSSGKGDTASALAREMNVDAGAVSRMIDRLEAKGMIQRVGCKDDRRVARLELTEQGRVVTAAIPAVLAEVLNHHLRGFTQDEAGQIKSQLRRMLENGGEPITGPCPGEIK